ncbi:MAG: hypothetical protein MK135_00310 [Polyangiaceae bacterium]|nr:hypothetical protein [Polyangiaceae bacterium]
MRSQSSKASSDPSLNHRSSSEFVETVPPSAVETVRDEEIPRYLGDNAVLAMLYAQVRQAIQNKEEQLVAERSGRLALQLMKRGIELRDAVELAERALPTLKDPALALELANCWAGSGDAARAAGILQEAIELLPEDQRGTAWRKVGKWQAQADRRRPAHQALRHAVGCDPKDPLAWEELGTLGFWSEIPRSEAARSFLAAATLYTRQGKRAASFENHLRAFEVDPSFEAAAEGLANALVVRGREAAADEVWRQHLRFASASTRAAFHQRKFLSALEKSQWAAALEYALEAELDIELDARALSDELSGNDQRSTRLFESLCLHSDPSSSTQESGEKSTWLPHWFSILIASHIHDWGREQTEELLRKYAALTRDQSGLEALGAVDTGLPISLYRQRLGLEEEGAIRRELRVQIAWREVLRGGWQAAFEVLEPLGNERNLEPGQAALLAIVSGRALRTVSRLRALALLAPHLPDEPRAVLLAVAAEGLLSQGFQEEARGHAELAASLLPSSGRVMATLARVALNDPQSASPLQLESSLAVLVAQGQACHVLAEAARRRRSYRLAMTWAERRFLLRPGDCAAANDYLKITVEGQDEPRILRALEQVFSRPLPLHALGESVISALEGLGQAPADLSFKAGELVLSQFGASSAAIIRALGSLASLGAGPRLAAMVLERQLVRAAPALRGELYLALAQSREQALDRVSACRALRKALSAGASPSAVKTVFADLGDVVEADARLAALNLRAELSSKNSDLAPAKLGSLYFQLGVARWDLAEDTAGALQALSKAARLDEELGLERFAHYLRVLAGLDGAVEHLTQLAHQTPEPRRSGRILGLGARILLEGGRKSEAFGLAEKALLLAPMQTEVLTLAERSSSSEEIVQLERLYHEASTATLGQFGERAVRYRAARFLENRGFADLGLSHAVAAFRAVPAEGVAYVLMRRLGESTGQLEPVVRALEDVAAKAVNNDERARWLEKAAAVTEGAAGAELSRVDILVRAALVRPEEATIRELTTTLSEVVRQATQARTVEELEERLAQVAEETRAHASGAHGATVCLLLAKSAFDDFANRELGLTQVRKALSCDCEVPYWQSLTHSLDLIATEPKSAHEILDIIVQLGLKKGKELGIPLLLWAAGLAERLKAEGVRAELLVQAADERPDDAELVSQARDCALRAGRPDLVEIVEELLPLEERARLVLERLPSKTAEEGLELLHELHIDELEISLRLRLLEAIAVRQEELGNELGAAAAWRQLDALDSSNELALRGLEREAERCGEFEELVKLLDRRAELAQGPEERRSVLMRRAVVLDTQLGRTADARRALEGLLKEFPESLSILRLVADSWERAGDSATAARAWEDAASAAVSSSDKVAAAARAAQAYFDAGEVQLARRVLDQEPVPGRECDLLRLKVAEALGDDVLKMTALIDLAGASATDIETAGRYYYEAALLSHQTNNLERTADLAHRAAMRLTENAETKLFAAEAQTICSTTQSGSLPQDAGQKILENLRDISGELEPEQAALAEVLRALALNSVEGLSEARRAIHLAQTRHGDQPLVLAAALSFELGSIEERLSNYQALIGTELRGLFSLSELLIEGARFGLSHGAFEVARNLAAAVGDDDPQKDVASLILTQVAHAESEAIAAEQKAVIEEAKAAREGLGSESVAPLAVGLTDETAAPNKADVDEISEKAGSLNRPSGAASSGAASSSAENSRDSSPSRRPASWRPSESTRNDEELVVLFEAGDLDAGRELLQKLYQVRGRQREAMIVAQHLAWACPADSGVLGSLLSLASRDGNEPLVLAVKHLLGTFGSGERVRPPKVDELDLQVDALQSVLWRGGRTPTAEAFAIIWEHAAGQFRKTFSDYSVSGVHRVSLSAPTVLSQLYRRTATVLGMGRTALFCPTTRGSIKMEVALLQPPAVVVSGEIRELTRELEFYLGAKLAACSPEHALVIACERPQIETLLEALQMAFGEGYERSSKPEPELARLAGVLWDTIPPRAQRRLRELCGLIKGVNYDALLMDTRLVLRRAGLVACGDLETAVQDVCRDEMLETPSNMAQLARLAESSFAMKDLLNLAISHEYAQLRFRRQVGAENW